MTELNNLDVIILIIVAISGLIALSRGLIKEVLSIIGWVLSGFAVVWLLPYMTPITAQYVSSGLIAGILSAIFILILFMIIWIIISESLIGKIRGSKLSSIDRVLGLFFGIMRAFLIIILINILVSWCMPPEKQPEVMQKSKYFQIAGDFAKPIENLIPQETLDAIKKKTDEYIGSKEEKEQEEKTEDKQKKLEADELFNRLAKPEIEKKADKVKNQVKEKVKQEAKDQAKEKIKEEFSGYNTNERENLERLIDMVE
ncbi:MAG: CvpA family protein [Alphaproteobacteria bacterium]|nr:CvpA family protein [Alphaproteobacteria bacterium]